MRLKSLLILCSLFSILKCDTALAASTDGVEIIRVPKDTIVKALSSLDYTSGGGMFLEKQSGSKKAEVYLGADKYQLTATFNPYYPTSADGSAEKRWRSSTLPRPTVKDVLALIPAEIVFMLSGADGVVSTLKPGYRKSFSIVAGYPKSKLGEDAEVFSTPGSGVFSLELTKIKH